jgi:hypothetical protein
MTDLALTGSSHHHHHHLQIDSIAQREPIDPDNGAVRVQIPGFTGITRVERDLDELYASRGTQIDKRSV